MKQLRSIGLIVLAITALIASTASAQVALKTGSVYGKIVDDKGAALPGVSITLESDVVPTQVSAVRPFRRISFCKPSSRNILREFLDRRIYGSAPGRRACKHRLAGQLEITLRPSLAEEFTVIGETPVVDTKKTGTARTSIVNTWKTCRVRAIHGRSSIRQPVSIRIATTWPVLNRASRHRLSPAEGAMTTPFGTTMV